MTKTTTAAASCHSLCRSSSTANPKPSWLLAALAELEEKYQSIAVGIQPGDAPDSFAERAENYYRKRPHSSPSSTTFTIATSLWQTATRRRLLHPSLRPRRCRLPEPDPDPLDSDAESSLSFQCPPPPPLERLPPSYGVDELVAELVARSVENEILQHEISQLDKYQSESTRKIELQSSLLEVLESERMVLLTENARLGTRAAAVEEENEGLSAEVGYLRRTAEELARCVVKLREDHRVCMLGRKIQELQAQIYTLEKRNRECYEVMARREDEKAELVRGVCMELERVKAENKRLREEAAAKRRSHSRKTGGGQWWSRLRGLDWVLCGSHVKITSRENTLQLF
ncbi:unnamed protein product [Spirodela intermedia]|uniref:Uncharacterized protein n=1 Tax=Spirodela intermedia TaxID=51605 RepID=A0A7I8IF99_SPIIN|nr:unnamed protein product [Spirodela intermedia]CAA6655773.1 unnamed protein product [Spirodela intermedia]